MKVKFLTRSAGPNGCINPGDIVDVSSSEGKLLIDGGYAIVVEAPAEKVIVTAPKPEPKKKEAANVSSKAQPKSKN